MNHINPYFDGVDRAGDPPQNLPLFQSADLQVSHEEIISAINNLDPKRSLDFNNLSMYILKKML